MKRYFKNFTSLMMAMLLLFSFSSCDNQEDNLTDLGTRLDALEAQADKLNKEINTLYELLQIIKDNTDYISSIKETDEGWLLTFIKSGDFLIKTGENGTDGHTPVVGVKKGDDSVYYWTVDGEWMRDGQGNLVPASGVDGKDVTDLPVIPKVRINSETRMWEMSTDGGKTWVSMNCKADGKDGVDNNIYLFKEVIIGPDFETVTIVLLDGTEIVLRPGV